jgi:hypothetical protein
VAVAIVQGDAQPLHQGSGTDQITGPVVVYGGEGSRGGRRGQGEPTAAAPGWATVMEERVAFLVSRT